MALLKNQDSFILHLLNCGASLYVYRPSIQVYIADSLSSTRDIGFGKIDDLDDGQKALDVFLWQSCMLLP
ncbi:MAG: hypothetical protein GY729_19095 [Desulfobacteraceae bacterium]|nr:hypothetical protein [Desulfobacteraceae bacterium]